MLHAAAIVRLAWGWPIGKIAAIHQQFDFVRIQDLTFDQHLAIVQRFLVVVNQLLGNVLAGIHQFAPSWSILIAVSSL